jgi:uncharacterized protein
MTALQGRRDKGKGKAAALCALVCVFCLFPCAFSLATPPAPPLLTKPVNDFASVIDAGSEQELERRIRALKEATGDVLVVATVPTFQPYADIKDYAVKMFENRGQGVGERKNDNGLLMVVAVNDRKVAIEVGYGIEPFVTDGFAGQTIREFILPPFREGQYGRGLVAGATRLITRIAEQRGVTLTDVPRPAASAAPESGRRRGGRFPTALLFIIVILVIRAIAGRTNRRRRPRYWGGGPWSGWSSGVGPFGGGSGGFGGGFGGFGGGGGGGFGGFGGGRSGGGGASGGW